MNANRTQDSGWKQLLGGLATGLVAILTVLAAILLSSQEAGSLAPTSVALASPSPAATPVTLSPTSLPASLTSTPVTSQASPISAASATPAPTLACPTPAGWSVYTVHSKDTLATVASAYSTSPYILIQGNCLVNTDLTAGQTLLVPPLPTRAPGPMPAPGTATRVPCGPPINWVIYRVQPGDTLYALSIRYGTTVYALAQANCMTGYTLRVNQPLYVPPVVVIPPTWTPAPGTATRVPPSATPTRTVAVSPSPTATLPPGATPSRTPTMSPAPSTATPAPSTATPAPSTATPAPSTATPTATETRTPQPPTVTTEPSATPPPTATLPPPTATPRPPTSTTNPSPLATP